MLVGTAGLLDLAGKDAGRRGFVVGGCDGYALLDRTALDDQGAGRGRGVLYDLVGVVRIVGVVRVLGVGGLAQLGLVSLQARQFDLEVRAGGVLPGGAERRLVDRLVAEQLLEEGDAGLDELQVVELAELGAQ